MRLDWTFRPVESVESQFPEASYPSLLRQWPLSSPLTRSYAEQPGAATILLPLGAIRFLSHLRALSHNRFLLLSADKAHAHAEDARLGKETPHLAIHGSFSFMTNFDALRVCVETFGGRSLHTPYYSGLQVAAFLVGAAPEFEFAWEVGKRES